MMEKLFFTVVLVECSRILVINPIPSYSHQIAIQPIVKELSKRGHDVLYATTHPIRNKSLTNLKEIDLGEPASLHAKTSAAKRNVNIVFELLELLMDISDTQLNHPEMQQLIKNKTEYFDLVMVGYITPTMCAFKVRFNCPMIGFASMDGTNSDHRNFGNFDNPALYPNILQYESFENKFLQRIYNVYVSVTFGLHREYVLYPLANEIVRSHFGEMYPHIGEIVEDADMFFATSNIMLSPVRPITPSTIMIGGGIQIRESEELPRTIKSFLDNSKRGIVYISFGTHVDSSKLPPNLIQMFLKIIAELPYDFLWKFEEDTLPNKPKNLLTLEWIPQQDVLEHTNVKLFITHAGLLSSQEGLYFGIPMLAIPFFGDQPYNAYQIADKKIGLKIDDVDALTCNQLKNTILELLENSTYLENVRRLGKIVKDEPMKPTEKAIWWIEYVLRHKGAKHLKGPIVPFYQRYLLDVFVFSALLLVLLAFSVCSMFKLLNYGKKCLIRNKLKLN